MLIDTLIGRRPIDRFSFFVFPLFVCWGEGGLFLVRCFCSLLFLVCFFRFAVVVFRVVLALRSFCFPFLAFLRFSVCFRFLAVLRVFVVAVFVLSLFVSFRFFVCVSPSFSPPRFFN
jgi:hypothetical protein